MTDQQYIDDAEMIWKDLKKNIKDTKFNSLNIDEQLEVYQKKYNDFTMTFPIVLRYMVQLKRYKKKAFENFLKKMRANPYRSELEYCERQADYVKYLYMETTKNHDMEEAKRVWRETYEMLAKEVKLFKKASEEIKRKTEKNNKRNNIEKREELKKLLNNV
jgi:hypothetical protein